MNATTNKAIERHGLSLLRAFPNAIEKDPIVLCKKLRRIETSLAAPILAYCNTGMNEDALEAAEVKAMARVIALLGITGGQAKEMGLFINRDPGGYAVKLDSDWVAAYNNIQYQTGGNFGDGLAIYTDMGGFGVLAPDLTTKLGKD